MKLYNYFKAGVPAPGKFGAMINANQLIVLDEEPSDRQAKKMLAEAETLVNAGWARRAAYLESRQLAGDEVDMEAERIAFYPKREGGKVFMPLQYLQDYMVRKIAAAQNNVSIHNPKELAEIKEVFDEYGVKLESELKELTLDYLSWSAKGAQKPKVLVHAKDAAGEDVCIRFEAAGELAQKFLNAVLAMEMKKDAVFNISVEAVDPGVERNKRLGKKVADEGKYVNHNITITSGGATHTGHPPKGVKFIQKPTMESMEVLLRQAQACVEGKTLSRAN